MPHEKMDTDEVARYLALSPQEVARLAERGRLPARKVGGGFEFRKGQVDRWVEMQIHELPRGRLEEIEQSVCRHHGLDAGSPLLGGLIPPTGIRVPLDARTRHSVIRELVSAAEAEGLVYDAADLVEQIEQREAVAPTTVARGVAIPHPAKPLPYDIAESFVIAGLTTTGIPFGATDGSLTRLFFLVCCKDERTHVHVLARICRILDDPTRQDLLEQTDPAGFRETLARRERGERPLPAEA